MIDIDSSWIQKILENNLVIPVIGQDWIQNWGSQFAITSPINGNWEQAFASALFQDADVQPINGSWIQKICEFYCVYEPINGSWIQALAQKAYPIFVQGDGYSVGNIVFYNCEIWICIAGIGESPIPPDAPENWALYSEGEYVSVYSQVVSFATPMNSIIYLCDGNYAAASYGNNESNLTNLVEMFNSSSIFLDYGVSFDNGDGRVRMEMPISVYNTLCEGELTLNVIYD